MHALAKAVGILTDPQAVLLLLLAAAGIAMLLGADLWLRGFTLAALVFACTIGLTPLPEWALRNLEERVPPTPIDWNAVDGIVVLGGGTDDSSLAEERQTYLLSGAAERLTAAVGLSRRHPDVPIVISGFSHLVDHVGWSEGEITRRLLADLGVPAERFLFEERSRNTFENAVETHALTGDTGGRHVLVTSAFHMPRAVATFRAQGFDVLAYPVDYRAPDPRRSWWPFDIGARFAWAEVALKEWLGLIAYRALGRTDTLLPS